MDIVEEIHQSFDTTALKNLKLISDEYPQITADSVPVSKKLDENINLAESLSKLGFNKSKSVVDLKDQKRTIQKQNDALAENKKLFSMLQTFNLERRKIISYKQLRAVCKKYNLFLTDILRFNGEIPESCAKMMLNYKSKYEHNLKGHKAGKSFPDSFNISSDNTDMMIASTSDLINMDNAEMVAGFHIENKIEEPKKGLLELIRNSAFKLPEPKFTDPIVLAPYALGTEIWFEIITAWGPEANDMLVRNELNN